MEFLQGEAAHSMGAALSFGFQPLGPRPRENSGHLTQRLFINLKAVISPLLWVGILLACVCQPQLC